MNSRDYKEIARINKEIYQLAEKIHRHNATDVLRLLFNKQADYFEREEKSKYKLQAVYDNFKKFNREQFLKDAGVK